MSLRWCGNDVIGAATATERWHSLETQRKRQDQYLNEKRWNYIPKLFYDTQDEAKESMRITSRPKAWQQDAKEWRRNRTERNGEAKAWLTSSKQRIAQDVATPDTYLP